MADETGSVDRFHNPAGSRWLEPDARRALAERQRMSQPPYLLDRDSRATVLAALRSHCLHRGWGLLAAQVQTNHVHAIVEAEVGPERVMNEFQSYASRALNLLDGRWTRSKTVGACSRLRAPLTPLSCRAPPRYRQRAFYFLLVLVQQLRICRFKTHYEHGLRVRGA